MGFNFFGINVPTTVQDFVDIFFPPDRSQENSSAESSTHAATPVTNPAPPPPPTSDSGTNAVNATPPSPPPGVAIPAGTYPDLTGRYIGNFEKEIILDLIDSLQRPPPGMNAAYITILSRTLSWLAREAPPSPDVLFNATGAQAMWNAVAFAESQAFGFPSNVLQPTYTGNGLDSQEKMRNEANRIRNIVYDVVNRVNSFVARAKNAGFIPPENPFALAMSLNVGRLGFSPVDLPGDIATRISANVQSYLTLLEAEATGKLNLDQNSFKAAQLSSANFSLDGYGGTGNTSVDLAKLLPDADAIKAQKSLEALSVFDFTKRIPKILFTAFYAPAGAPLGVIVGWRKSSDASGYVIRRKNIFDDREAVYSVTNADAAKHTARLREYVGAWILSFYDNIQEDVVFTFLDTDIPPHGYFFYRVQAYQLQNDSPGAMFAVPTTTVSLPQHLKNSIRAELEVLDPNKERDVVDFAAGTATTIIENTPDTISPYPILAKFFFQAPEYDWILAALNIRASINRGDTRTNTRNFSYLTAQLDFLFSQIDAGKFVLPSGDITNVLKNIEESISKFGVNQVIKEILQETGALYHFEGKDPNDNALFKSIDTQESTESSLIAAVASAVDPETMTMNLKTLSNNLPALLSGEFVTNGQSLTKKVGNHKHKSKAAKPSEIKVPSEHDTSTGTKAEDEIQYLRELDNLPAGVIDLTTSEGISIFMRVIRIFSDIGPNRGTPIASVPEPEVVDPIVAPLPPAPPPSPVQPVLSPEQQEEAAHDAAVAAGVTPAYEVVDGVKVYIT